jgi:NAD(P)-dependent dehydrogenase (short-subunit alcohol dehydrogenase family)
MPASYDLSESTAVVTGAAGDIGRATALRLADTRANLVVTDLDLASEALEGTRAACAQRAGDDAVLAITADLTVPGSVKACFDAIADQFAAPDLVFNNAGIQGALTPLYDYPSDDFPHVMNVNVFSIFNVLKECAVRLKTEGRSGSVVNSASMAGVDGGANMVAYSASKGAIMSMTRSAAKDLAPLGIRVNAISPAFIGEGKMWELQTVRQAEANTQYYSTAPKVVEQEMVDMVPLRRTGKLDEVASAVLWLLSDESSYVTGHNLIVSGGI